MKLTWKNVAVVALAIGGGSGIAAITSSLKSPSSAVAAMTDTSVVSMYPESHLCERCTSGDHSMCVLGGCSAEINLGMGMVSDQPLCEQCSNGDHAFCTTDRCTPSETKMSMVGDATISSDTMAMVQVMDAKLSDMNMAPAMSTSISPSMSEKPAASTMNSGIKADQNGSKFDQKM